MTEPDSLPRKQVSDHGAWLRAFDRARNDPRTPARAERLITTAAERVRWFLNKTQPHHPAFGWSGGKDSLVLEVVCKEAHLTDAVLVISGLEYPAFLAWATDNMPWGLAVECRHDLNLAWLKAHPSMLFPADGNTAARWFALTQHAGQRAYAQRTGCDLLLLGRRKADGNFCGEAHTDPEGLGGYSYHDRDGFVRYSPIADWSHEDVLSVLAACGIDLPPCYDWPRGFRVGTGPWPARQWTTSREHGWSEILRIDPTVVETAARAKIPGAHRALVLYERDRITHAETTVPV